MFSRAYWKDLGERVGASFLVSVAPFFVGDAVDLWHLDYKLILSLGAAAAVGSLIKGLIARLTGNPESASLVK